MAAAHDTADSAGKPTPEWDVADSEENVDLQASTW